MVFGAAGYLPQTVFEKQGGITASADTYGDFEYEVIYDGSIEITGYIGTETSVNIPSNIDGKKVTSISDSAITVLRELI